MTLAASNCSIMLFQTWCNKYKPEALTNTVLTDPHAPGKFRVEVVAKNQKEFAAVGLDLIDWWDYG